MHYYYYYYYYYYYFKKLCIFYPITLWAWLRKERL